MFSRNWIAVTAVFAIAWLAPSALGQAAEEEVPKGARKKSKRPSAARSTTSNC